MMKTVKVVASQHNERVDSDLLNLIAKVSQLNSELALKVLAICNNDDVPRRSILDYLIKELENESVH